MGLSATIALAANGLKVAQEATQLVGANVGSASTDGYTKKTLSIQDIQSGYGIIGFQTEVTRAFDQQLYDQLVGSTSSTSYLDTKSTYAAQVDTLMGTTSTGATLSTALASFSSDMQALASAPSDTAAQTQAVNSATSLAKTLNQMSSQVKAMKTSVDGDIDDGITAVNDLTKQIAGLNTQIVSYKTQGLDATNLEDTRDNAILKLSTYMDVQVKGSDDGSVRITTNEALTLVDNARPTQFTRDTSGRMVVSNAGNGAIDVYGLGLASSGSLAALYELRDHTLPQLQSQLDQTAANLATAMSDTTLTGTAVTSGAQNGYAVDLSTLQSGNKVTLSYTDNTTGTSKTVTLVKTTDSTSLPLANSATANPDDKVVGIDFSGGMSSVVTQIQAALGSSFSVSNPSGSTLQVLDDGAAGTIDISSLTAAATATSTQDGTVAVPLFTDGAGLYTGSFDNSVSQIDGFASRITVNSAITAKPNLMVKYSSTSAASDASRPTAMSNALLKATNWYTLDGSSSPVQKTLSGFSDAMVSYWGTQATNAKTDLASQTVIQNNLKSSMSSVSSVSTDTELAKLIQLQSTYSANAHVMSTVRDMLNSLLQSV